MATMWRAKLGRSSRRRAEARAARRIRNVDRGWVEASHLPFRSSVRQIRPCGPTILLLIASFAACDQKLERTFKDTEGRTFSGTCRPSGCELERSSGSPTTPEKTAVRLGGAGRLVGVCDVVPSAASASSAAAGDCRALVCSADSDCPAIPPDSTGHCLNGLCIDPAQQLNTRDAVMLCLAGTGLGRSKPEQVERYALALNCGTPCQIPTPCRKP